MKYSVIILSFLISFPFLNARSQDEPDTALASRIRDMAMNHSRVMDLGSQLMDGYGPRLTWSPGYDSAARWALNQFRQWGLQNIHTEEWEPMGTGWNFQKCYAALKVPYYQNLMCTPKAWSGSTNGLVSGNVMLVKAKDSLEFVQKYKGKLKGKIILFESDIPPPSLSFKSLANRFSADSLEKLSRETNPDSNMLFSNDTTVMTKTFQNLKNLFKTYFMSDLEWVWAFCNKEGALAILSRGMGSYGTYGADGSYNFLFKPNRTLMADISLRSEDFLRLIRLLHENKTVKMELDVRTTRNPEAKKGYNLVADIPGSDSLLKKELVMIGGHFDSWHGATGATDNGAGSIVMMEVMRILKNLSLPLKRTVRIVLWGGEEQGLLGSLAYVNKNVATLSTMKPGRDYDLISAYYNLDNGSGRIRGIHLQNNPRLRTLFEQWFLPFKDLDASTVSIKNSGYTDHECFDLAGIPAFQFIQDELDYESRTHHTNADSYERLSADDLKQAVAVVSSLVAFTANRPEKLARKPVPRAVGNFNFLLFD